MSFDGDVTTAPEATGGPIDNRVESGNRDGGPLRSLYSDKYRRTFLQFPSNLESAEQNHWIRFDIKELRGRSLQDEEIRTLFNEENNDSFLERITKNTAEKAGIVARTALLAPINAAKSTVNAFLNDLPPGLGDFGKDFLRGNTSRARGLGSIMLYAPYTRQDALSLQWGEQQTGIAGSGFQSGGATLKGAATSTFGMNNETLAAFRQNIKTLAETAATKVIGGVIGNDTVDDLFLRGQGRTFNNQLEAFFQNVNFRTFTFDFKLAPRNPSDAREIRDIVQMFKYASTPALVGGEFGVYFAYPNVFDIEFHNEEQTHKIAQSALKSITVNHAGADTNSTFYDKYPLETHITLSFTELEILHKDKVSRGY